MQTRPRLAPTAAALLAAVSTLPANADITGFNNLTGWTPVVDDTAPPISLPNADTVQLTTGGGNLRAIWFNTPQSVDQFTAHFTYRVSNTTGSSGLSFVMHNDPRGLSALGSTNASNGFFGISNSFAIAFDYSFFDDHTYVGVGQNGSVSSSEDMDPTTAVNRDLNVSVAYGGGSILAFTAVDALDPGISFTRNYVLPESIASIVGSNSAIVGFAAGTNGGPPGITQTLSDFSFIVPAPSTAVLLGAGALGAARRRR